MAQSDTDDRRWVDFIDAHIECLVLTAAEWAAIRANHAPPQAWFDDDNVPFES